MELLGENAEFRLHDTRMHILSNFNEHPSHFIGRDGRVEHSMICNGCEIYGEVYNSILSPGVTVEKGRSGARLHPASGIDRRRGRVR